MQDSNLNVSFSSVKYVSTQQSIYAGGYKTGILFYKALACAIVCVVFKCVCSQSIGIRINLIDYFFPNSKGHHEFLF